MNPSIATHLDGPKLIAWLRERGSLPTTGLNSYVGKRWECQVRRWANGRALHVHTADEFLLSIGVQLGEVPDDLYRAAPGRLTAPVSEEERARMVALRGEGLPVGTIARRLGRDHNTVKRYVAEAVTA
jgi:DNA-binding CsgD family transcriptional regulator